MASYQWRATATLNGSVSSDNQLTYGSTTGSYLNWQTGTIGESKSITEGYYYHDANVAVSGYYTDANSSRVVTYLSESWSTSVDDLNNLTVTITQTLSSIVRDSAQGYNSNTPGRGINVYSNSGATQLLSLTDYQVATNHTIYSGPLNISTYSFTIAPGGSYEMYSMNLHNWTVGYPQNYDDVWIGAQFRNILPNPTTYTLNYSANGGSGAPSSQTRTTAQSSVSFTVPSTTPTWGLYEFLGWSWTQYTDSRTEEDVEYVAGDTVTLYEANPTRTLYAVWRMDYRPGCSYGSAGTWLGHERSGGTCHVLTDTSGPTYTEMRTIGGEVNQLGNPPSSYHDSRWYNMKRIGLE